MSATATAETAATAAEAPAAFVEQVFDRDGDAFQRRANQTFIANLVGKLRFQPGPLPMDFQKSPCPFPFGVVNALYGFEQQALGAHAGARQPFGNFKQCSRCLFHA